MLAVSSDKIFFNETKKVGSLRALDFLILGVIQMIIYFTHKGGKYFPVDQSLKIDPTTPRGLYVNLTNRCNCDCVFCLRQKKSMARESSLWLEREPTVAEFDNFWE